MGNSGLLQATEFVSPIGQSIQPCQENFATPLFRFTLNWYRSYGSYHRADLKIHPTSKSYEKIIFSQLLFSRKAPFEKGALWLEQGTLPQLLQWSRAGADLTNGKEQPT
jgi:hypothetical protein